MTSKIVQSKLPMKEKLLNLEEMVYYKGPK